MKGQIMILFTHTENLFTPHVMQWEQMGSKAFFQHKESD